jgi:hypothetical protein
VQVETDASGRRSVDSDARLEDIEPKSSVIVYVRAYDCRRSPIQRLLDDYPLHVHLDSGSAHAHDGHSDIDMAFAPTAAEPNLYRATLPQAWVNSTGTMRLVVLTNVTGVVDSARAVTLTLVLTEKSFSVSKVVGAVIGVGLGVLLLCLVKLLRRNWAAAKETLKTYMKFEFRLGVEMSTRLCSSVGRCRKPLACRCCCWLHAFIAGVDLWDLAGDTYVVVNVHQSRSGLALWYDDAVRAIGRCALHTHRALLKVLHILRPRSLRGSVRALHEDEVAHV